MRILCKFRLLFCGILIFARAHGLLSIPLHRLQLDTLKSGGNGENVDLEVKYPLLKMPRDKSSSLRGPLHETIKIHDYQNTVYYGEVRIGTPSKPYSILFDTGSAALWIPSIDCPHEDCDGKNLYNAKNSTTAINLHQDVHIDYEQGPIQGRSVSDIASVAGVEFAQTFGSINDTKGLGKSYSKWPFDGVLGMGWGWDDGDPTTKDPPTVLDCLFDSPQWNGTHQFAFHLGMHNSQDGELVLGGIEESHFEGPLFWMPISRKNSWQLYSPKVEAANHIFIDHYVDLLIDTGTSFIIAPKYAVKRMAQAWGATCPEGERYCSVPCDAKVSLGFLFPLSPESAFEEEGKSRPFILDESDLIFANDGKCYLRAVPTIYPLWILGDVFLRRYYAVFDRKEQKIGLAPSVYEKIVDHDKELIII